MTELPFHPLANLFPLMEGPTLEGLIADIRDNGQREGIVTLEGMILDGRNRYRACLALNISPEFREFGCLSSDGDSALAFIISKNLNRRHLSESQRAMAAARLATMRQGERTDLQPSATLPKVSQARAAELMNVSDRLLRSAKTVLDSGAPALVHAIERNRLNVSQGAIAARLDPQQQEDVAVAAETGPQNATSVVTAARLR
jgi:hypothetical protein